MSNQKIYQSDSSLHPLDKVDEYLMLMHFFTHAANEYVRMAAQKNISGDQEAYKYYAGVADGIKICLKNIETFKDKKFLDPAT